MGRIYHRLRRAAAIACGFLAVATSVKADEIKVLTTGILKGAFTEIAKDFGKESGHKVSMSWGPSSGNSPEASPVRIRNGEPVDVLIMVDTAMNGLIQEGYFAATERKDVAVSKIGVAVKAGRPSPDISTPAALRQALLNASSIGYSEGASGSYVASVLLKKLGIADEVAARSKVILGRQFVGEAVAHGDVEIGIQQLSELRLEPGVTVVGPLPDELQKLSVVSAAVSAKAGNPEVARQFVAFLSTRAAIEAIRKSGLDIPAAEPGQKAR